MNLYEVTLTVVVQANEIADVPARFAQALRDRDYAQIRVESEHNRGLFIDMQAAL